MQTQRYLATLTEYNHQLVSGLVVEVSNDTIRSVFRLTDRQYETAHTLYLDGILRGNLQTGAKADLYLCDTQHPSVIKSRYPFI